ncbi:MAG: 23S rRNA (uracil(1939)-C(5))-methyltransferase RlmD [Acidobacteriota bacterium]
MKRPNKPHRSTKRSPAPEVPPQVAQQVVEIEKPIYGGNFLARQDGKAIFVPFVLPGEQAKIQLVEEKAKRGYALAELAEILSTSGERIRPRCPHFGPCGGCNYQHTGYANQLRMKEAILRETFERAGVPIPQEIDILSAEPWEYRNRIRIAFDADGNPGYRARRSSAIIPIRECPIAAPVLINAAFAARDALARVPANLRPHELLLFCNAEESAMLATFFTGESTQLRFDPVASALHERIPQLQGAELASGGRPGRPPRTLARWGAPSLTYHAGGFDYRVDHGAFFQVNRWLIDSFVQRVTTGHSGKLAWDLFAGVGLFARQLTKHFEGVIAVESAPASTAALAANLAGTCGQPVAMNTLAFLRQDAGGARPDLIVVDPPRTGLGAEITTLLNQVAAPNLVYVSCDPATLARDLRLLLDGGYRIQAAALADLFPQTFHLETLIKLHHS